MKDAEIRAMEMLSRYEMLNPQFDSLLRSGRLLEVITRRHRPYELELLEVTSEGEFVYLAHVARSLHNQSPFAITNHQQRGIHPSTQAQSSMLDKRHLGPQQYTYKKYVFNYESSLFMRYLHLTEHTRLLFLFRRLNTCHHRYSCLESIARGFFKVVRTYLVLRLPLRWAVEKVTESQLMDSKVFIAAEIAFLLFGGILAAGGGCLLRYLHEEVIHPQVDPTHLRASKSERL